MGDDVNTRELRVRLERAEASPKDVVPMLAIAATLYFLIFRDAALAWLADVSVLF